MEDNRIAICAPILKYMITFTVLQKSTAESAVQRNTVAGALPRI